jgi:phosphatidylglycerophosphate synthase
VRDCDEYILRCILVIPTNARAGSLRAGSFSNSTTTAKNDDMSSVKYIVANYLRVLGMPDETIAEMLGYLSEHSSFPSLRSIVESFEEWQFDCTAAEATEEQLRLLGNSFIAYTSIFDGSFALVIVAGDDEIIYLNSIGDVVKEPYDLFVRKWNSHVIFVAERTDLSGQRKGEIISRSPIGAPSISDLKKVAFYQDEPFTYKIFRRVSIYCSYWLVRWRVDPNVISLLWLVAMMGASWVVSFSSGLGGRLIAIGLVCLHFILDCCDGEVARITNRTSRVGSNLEQTIHWIVNLALILGSAWGLYRQNGTIASLSLGLICLAGDATFHFFYIQLNYWLNPHLDYGWFHKISSYIFPFMPMNINLFAIFCLIGRLDLFLLIWAIVSFTLFVLLAIGYFGKEFSVSVDKGRIDE